MDLENLANLPLDRMQRIKRRHRLLKHHGDRVAPDAAEPVLIHSKHILPIEQDFPCRMRGRGIGQQFQD